MRKKILAIIALLFVAIGLYILTTRVLVTPKVETLGIPSPHEILGLDGRKLYLARDNQIYKLDLDNLNVFESLGNALAPTEGRQPSPATLSPNKQEIFYTSAGENDHGYGDSYLLNVNSGEEKKLEHTRMVVWDESSKPYYVKEVGELSYMVTDSEGKQLSPPKDYAEIYMAAHNLFYTHINDPKSFENFYAHNVAEGAVKQIPMSDRTYGPWVAGSNFMYINNNEELVYYDQNLVKKEIELPTKSQYITTEDSSEQYLVVPTQKKKTNYLEIYKINLQNQTIEKLKKYEYNQAAPDVPEINNVAYSPSDASLYLIIDGKLARIKL